MQNPSYKDLLFYIITNCSAVIVHRATPSQKSDIVNLIRERTDETTLAIGDGGNDVAMIKAAHIGIGIYGKEGYQAASNSDYAIGEFKHLWRLMFVHGRWNGIRITYFAYFFYYKNILFALCQMYFAINNGFSGQTMFDDNYLLLYNTIITAVPIVVYALLHQDLNPKSHPIILKFMYFLYYETSIYELFNLFHYFIWIFYAFLHSAMIYYVSMYLSNTMGTYESDGKQSGFWLTSLIQYTCVIFLQIAILFTDNGMWNWVISVLYWFFGIIFYFPLFILVYDTMNLCYFSHYVILFLNRGEFWIMLLFCIVSCYLTIYLYNSVYRLIRPSFRKSILEVSSHFRKPGKEILTYPMIPLYGIYPNKMEHNRFVSYPYSNKYVPQTSTRTMNSLFCQSFIN